MLQVQEKNDRGFRSSTVSIRHRRPVSARIVRHPDQPRPRRRTRPHQNHTSQSDTSPLRPTTRVLPCPLWSNLLAPTRQPGSASPLACSRPIRPHRLTGTGLARSTPTSQLTNSSRRAISDHTPSDRIMTCRLAFTRLVWSSQLQPNPHRLPGSGLNQSSHSAPHRHAPTYPLAPCPHCFAPARTDYPRQPATSQNYPARQHAAHSSHHRPVPTDCPALTFSFLPDSDAPIQSLIHTAHLWTHRLLESQLHGPHPRLPSPTSRHRTGTSPNATSLHAPTPTDNSNLTPAQRGCPIHICSDVPSRDTLSRA